MAVVGVVVVTYQSAGTIGACLRSLGAASVEHRVDLIVLDNASTDESASAAEAAHPSAVVVRRAANDGYATACNDGLGRLDAATDWIVFANPDTVWPPGSLDALVAAAAADASIGLASPRLVDADGVPQPMVEQDLRLSRVLRGMTRLGPPVRPDLPPEATEPVDVAWLHTAAALLPAALARELHGFDERFFLFAEDADLCVRVRGQGRRVVVVPHVQVTHIGGASVDATNTAGDAAALRTRALAAYLDKHEGAMARRLFGLAGTAVYGLIGDRARAAEAWRAVRE